MNNITKNNGTLTGISKNSGTVTNIDKNGAISYLLTDASEQILVGQNEDEVLILAEANPLTNIAKNV